MDEQKVTRRPISHVRLYRKIGKALSRPAVMTHVRRVVLAFSGGMDSSVLLHILMDFRVRFGWEIFPVHVHHGVRGGEADRDAEFCRGEASRYGLSLAVEHLSLENQNLPEHRLRQERYRALFRAMRRVGATRILLAHHQDDQVETILFRFMTGANFLGLGGMQSFRRPYLVRPMLGVTKQEIQAEAAACSVNYVEDSSNRGAHPKRNFIRRQLLPLVRAQLNPKIGEHLGHLGETFADLNDLFNRSTKSFDQAWCVGEGLYRVALYRATGSIFRMHWLQRAYRERHPQHRSLRREQLLLLDRFLCDGKSSGEIQLPHASLLRKSEGTFSFVFIP